MERIASAMNRLLVRRISVLIGTDPEVQVFTAFDEPGMVAQPVNGVRQEQTAEEKDFRRQEGPDAERRGFLLLRAGLELLGNRSGWRAQTWAALAGFLIGNG